MYKKYANKHKNMQIYIREDGGKEDGNFTKKSRKYNQ